MKCAILTLMLLCSGICLAAENQQIAIRPEETDEILANPGMGWQTFHRPARQDKTLPAWIPSTIYYIRWGWGEVEPQPGKIDFDLIDRTLAAARESGQKLAFRVMTCSTSRNRPYHPAWLKQLGGKEIAADYSGGGPFPVPDMDDPVFLERHLDFIKRLGQHYDGHPDLDHVDIGSIGWWGEWHMSSSKSAKMPTVENRKKVIDAYLAAFRKTPLLMLIGGGECLTYAAQRGAGWRADCLGDLGGFSKTWCHMRKGYPVYIKDAKIEDTWKTAPVAWETCWDMRKWVAEGWSLRFIFNYALACHGSYINNKSAPLPEGENVRPELERFLRRLGYRFVLKELRHPPQANAGQKFELAMKWQNNGSAPCYRPYRLAYRLTPTSGDAAPRQFTSDITVTRWMPGSIPLFTAEFFKEPADLPPGEVVEVKDAINLPADLPAGTYALSVGIVEKVDGNPIVRLAIKGRDNSGWYPLSRIEIGR